MSMPWAPAQAYQTPVRKWNTPTVDGPVLPPSGIRVWDGAVWPLHPLMLWDGVDWVPYPIHDWDGTDWVRSGR